MLNSEKIKSRIKDVGENQESCAQKMGMAVCTFNQKINNIRVMRLEEAEKLAVILRISDKDFSAYFFGENVALCNK